MNHAEVENCLRDMVYCVDTREQPNLSLAKRLAFLEPHVRETVNAGDYTAKTLLPDGTWFYVPAAIERKMSLTEIAGNFCRGRERFRAEFNRFRENEIQPYILIERASWEKAYSGAYLSKMSPSSLVASLIAWMVRYRCPVIMCESPEMGGKLIRDILYREMQEALEAMVDDD